MQRLGQNPILTVFIGFSPCVVACAVNDLSNGGEAKNSRLTLAGLTFKTVLQPRFVGAQNNGGGAVTATATGGWAFDQEQGALKIHADQAGIGDTGGISVADLDVQSPTYHAVHVQGPNGIFNVTLNNVTVSNPGNGVLFLNWGARGSMTVNNLTAAGSPQGVRNDTGGAFSLVRGGGNSGW